MKAILPILACLAAWLAATPLAAQTADGPASSPPGEPLVDQVIAGVEAQASIAAKVRHRVEVLGRPPLIGTGHYLQQGRGEGRCYRLELELRTTLFATQVEQVCDGAQWWSREEFDGFKLLSVVDVARLARARPKAKPTAPPPPVPDFSTLGGLSHIVRSLQQNFDFDRVTQSRLDDLRVWSIEGTWSRARLLQLLPDQQAAIAAGATLDLKPLAASLPHRVVLHVGSDDLFPYRLEYWRTDAGPDGADPTDDRQQLIVVMELYEVQFNAPIDPGQFAFRPAPGAVAADRTKEYLDRFGLEDPPVEEAKRRLRDRL